VVCHLLAEVKPNEPSGRHGRYFVDARGILRHSGRHEHLPWRQPLPEPEKELCAWLAGRRILEHGERLYWLEVTLHGAFRQRHQLSPSDAQRFKTLPAWFREHVTGPARLDPQQTREHSARWS
jgi:hypothetical protein